MGRNCITYAGMGGGSRARRLQPTARDGGKVTTGGDGTARLWTWRAGRNYRSYAGHEGWVTSAQFAADGRIVVTAGRDGTRTAVGLSDIPPA